MLEPFAEGAVVAQRYRILKEIGRGGMGVVYRVEHIHTGQEHALKILNVPSGLSAELVERFKREARAPARIKSEHVVTVTDADVMPERGGTPFLVMELLDGTDLERVLDERQRMTSREVIDVFEQIARVLDKAHALGIVHRDLKPENLFFHRRADGSTVLKVLDFGISKLMGEGDGDPVAAVVLTRPGALMGTPLYMSPEQAGTGGTVGPRSDVWALGIVTVRLLTGEYYWRAQSVGEMMAQLLRDPLYPPRDRWPWLPEGFDAWFARSCDRDPDKRFATVSEQLATLAAVLGESLDAFRRPSLGPVLAPMAVRIGTERPSVRELGATTPADDGHASPLRAPVVASPRRAWGRWLALVAAALVGLGVVGLAVVRFAVTGPTAAPTPPADLKVVDASSASLVPPTEASQGAVPTASSALAHDASTVTQGSVRRDAGVAAPGRPTHAGATATTHNPVAP